MRQLIGLIESLADAFDRLGLQYAVGGALANNYVRRWAGQMLEDAVQRELDALIAAYGGSDQSGQDI